QLYPLATFAWLGAGFAVAAPARAVRGTALLTAALLGLQLYAKGVQELRPAWITAKSQRVDRIVADLRGRVGPEDTVQVLDTGEGGIHALLRLGVREPTRFLYDFPFFHDEDRPVVRAYCWLRFGILRQRFLDEIGQYLPPSGEVLDLGCGFGLFSLYYASIAPGRFVRGLDVNGRRIAMARHAAERLAIANVAYRQGDARDVGGDGEY